MAVSSRMKRTSACGRAVGKLVKSGVGERVWLAGAHHFHGRDRDRPVGYVYVKGVSNKELPRSAG